LILESCFSFSAPYNRNVSTSRMDDDSNDTMPLLSISSPETIQKCKALPLHDTDIFICSYPKSGTTWLQHIILSCLIASKSDEESASCCSDLSYDHVSDFAPFFEIDPHWQGDELADWIQRNQLRLGRRVFNTHLRYDMLPRGTAKFIYIVRSPLDVCVSFFHHLSHQVEGGYEGNLDEFFRDWMEGKIAFGSWIAHVKSYLPAFVDGKKNVEGEFLFLSYEDLINNLPETVNKLIEFLELDNVTATKQRALLPTFSFAHMKSESHRFQPKSVSWKNQFSFLRKGKSGDAKTIITKEQQKMYEEWMDKSGFEKTVETVLGKSNPRTCSKITQLL